MKSLNSVCSIINFSKHIELYILCASYTISIIIMQVNVFAIIIIGFMAGYDHKVIASVSTSPAASIYLSWVSNYDSVWMIFQFTLVTFSNRFFLSQTPLLSPSLRMVVEGLLALISISTPFQFSIFDGAYEVFQWALIDGVSHYIICHVV